MLRTFLTVKFNKNNIGNVLLYICIHMQIYAYIRGIYISDILQMLNWS